MTEPTFEENLKELEEILRQLEHEDLPLESALAKFEAGMRLVRLFNQQLDAVDRKVEIILQDESGNFITKPFQVSNDPEGADS